MASPSPRLAQAGFPATGSRWRCAFVSMPIRFISCPVFEQSAVLRGFTPLHVYGHKWLITLDIFIHHFTGLDTKKALRRQRSYVRIVSGPPALRYYVADAPDRRRDDAAAGRQWRPANE